MDASASATPATPAAPADSPQEGFDLDAAELRVLGVLIEKSFITPDSYPLSLNALTNGCNQSSARDPVMALAPDAVEAAVLSLAERRLVSERSQASGRVAKYEHQVRLRHSLPPPAQAVLAILLLRGPQTAGELRQRCERLHRFDSITAVEEVLEHLADKYPPMATALPRAPGTKEMRYMHLLGGAEFAADSAAAMSPAGSSPARGRNAELEAEVDALRTEVAALREEVASLRALFD